jgi:alpha-tubulin suppressor-like RCC1 family protein
MIDEGEQCDDGNQIPDDLCNAECLSNEIEQLDAGRWRTCIRTAGGQIHCWGVDASQAGYAINGHIGDDELPSEVGALQLPAPAKQMSVGYNHVCMVTNDGDLYCWGDNTNGQLGLGNTDDTDGLTPAQVPAVDVGGPVEQVSAGYWATCAVLVGGSVRCWGYNISGQLGMGLPTSTKIGDDELPSEVPILDAPPTLEVHLSTLYPLACLLGTVDNLHCWGMNGAGSTGTPGPSLDAPPNTPVSAIAADQGPQTVVTEVFPGGATCVRYNSGDGLCWGTFQRNGQGLGIDIGDDELPSEFPSLDLGNQLFVATGESTGNICAVTSTGAVYCWGVDQMGSLGYPGVLETDPMAHPIDSGPVDIGAPIVAITSGQAHHCVLTLDNEVRCWGSGAYGALGYGNNTNIGDNETPASAGSVSIF